MTVTKLAMAFILLVACIAVGAGGACIVGFAVPPPATWEPHMELRELGWAITLGLVGGVAGMVAAICLVARILHKRD